MLVAGGKGVLVRIDTYVGVAEIKDNSLKVGIRTGTPSTQMNTM